MPAVETEQPPPKPKKFFKSRNAEAYPPVPQITYAPPVPAAPLSPEHSSGSKNKKTQRNKAAYSRDSSSPEAPRYKGSEKTKARKNSVSTKAAKKDEAPGDETKPPNKRYLVRNRDKVINYAEDGSNSPIPDFSRFEQVVPPKPSPLPAPPILQPPSPKPSSSTVASPNYGKPEMASPKEGSEDRKPPPIVLRISKGTSRIVSTDSNEGFTSPGSDRHSSMDVHSDYAPELKMSPSVDTISSPRSEGLKITIKCSGLNESVKKERKKDKKEHKSHKRHHKNSDDEPLKKPASPQPGSDTYELYKTLASPVIEVSGPEPVMDELESELAKLDSTGPSTKSPKLEVPTEPLPEPKPPEATTGRSRRNRVNINYSENDDFLDAVTSKRLPAKVVPEPKKEGRSRRKKNMAPALDEPPITSPEHPVTEATPESQLEKHDLIEILSGGAENTNVEPEPLKLRIPKKQKHKQSPKVTSPEIDDTQEDDLPLKMPQETSEDLSSKENEEQSQNPSQSPESTEATGISSNNEYAEDNGHKSQDDEMFKLPPDVNEPEDKPCVKLVITKKKGSIFKSKSLVNDNLSSPLPARKRRHLYRHQWANDVSFYFSNYIHFFHVDRKCYTKCGSHTVVVLSSLPCQTNA